MLEITRKLGESLTLEDVLEKTLESLFKFFPQADRGFVLLKQGENSISTLGRSSSATVNRATDDQPDDPEARVQRVQGDPQLRPRDRSPVRARARASSGAIRMMMCVPLLDVDRRPAGILQIDTCDDRGKFTEDDLDLLVAVASQVSVAVENARLHSVLIEQTQIEQESQDAHEVQLALLPERRPELPGYEFWDYYEPARFVGGDYFDYLPLRHSDTQGSASPRRWLVALGDVAGKGMPGAS